MILNLDPKRILLEQRWRFGEKFMLLITVSAFTFVVIKMFELTQSTTTHSQFTLTDNTQDVALHLFKNYVWPFEIVSMLILLAIVGAIYIVKKNKETP